MNLRRRSLVLLPAAWSLAGASRADEPPSSLVLSSTGTLPLLLTVPHDGTEPIGQLMARSHGAVVRDLGTQPLAERVSARLEQRLGGRPSMVVARFSRKYLDANRAPQDAMESPEALPVYDAYHGAVAGHVAALKRAFPAGALLVDVHGQSDEPDTTFRGTRAGLTTRALLARHGADALQGEHSLIGQLAAKGYRVSPEAGGASLHEDPRFAGGHTVFTYGSQRPEGIDAIQLEFGRNHRARPDLAEHVADALAVFLTHHGFLTR